MRTRSLIPSAIIRLGPRTLRRRRGTLSRFGAIGPGMIGVMRPVRMLTKRDFEEAQEGGFLLDFARRFWSISGMGFGVRKLSPSRMMR
jgi:hypothetical protein